MLPYGFVSLSLPFCSSSTPVCFCLLIFVFRPCVRFSTVFFFLLSSATECYVTCVTKYKHHPSRTDPFACFLKKFDGPRVFFSVAWMAAPGIVNQNCAEVFHSLGHDPSGQPRTNTVSRRFIATACESSVFVSFSVSVAVAWNRSVAGFSISGNRSIRETDRVS